MRDRGQSILEYAMIISIVVAALAAMSIYVQRSAQANLRMIENQINAQPAATNNVVCTGRGCP